MLEILGQNNPPKDKLSSSLPPKGTSLDQTASFEPLCVKIGCVVRAVEPRKKYIYIYKPINAYTKNAHWCYISSVRGDALS